MMYMVWRYTIDGRREIKAADTEEGVLILYRGEKLEDGYEYYVTVGGKVKARFTGSHAYVEAWMWCEDTFGEPNATMEITDPDERILDSVVVSSRRMNLHTFELDVLFKYPEEDREYPDEIRGYVNLRDTIVTRSDVPVIQLPKYDGWLVHYGVS